MKVLVLGDSITKGVIFDESKQKYVTIENGFVKKIAESFEKLTIDNLSLMGSTVTRGMTTLERLGDELESYDYTVIEFGGNDCDFDWAAVAQDPTIDHQSKTPIMLFKQTYSSLIEKIQSHGSKPIILSLPPIDAQKYFDWVSNGKNSDNILKFLGDKQHIARWQQMYNLAAL
ncbi:MAG: SGNH/GDSL hydrolase family protein, partial [Clostridia bacterium]